MNTNEYIIENRRCKLEDIERTSSVFTVSNGYLGIKATVETLKEGRFPTTLVHGVFDTADMIGLIKHTNKERRYLNAERFDSATPSPSIANLPNPLYLQIFVNNKELSFTRCTVSNFIQSLDMRSGEYACSYVLASQEGDSVEIAVRRFADMENPHAVWMRINAQPFNKADIVMLKSGIDGSVRSNLRLDKQFTVERASAQDDDCTLNAHLPARDIRVNLAVRHKGMSPTCSMMEHDKVYAVYKTQPNSDQSLALDKYIVLTSSLDEAFGADTDCSAELNRMSWEGYDNALERNRAWWQSRWAEIDVNIEGDDLALKYLRFCLFHIVSAAPRHTDKLSAPCKLLTGEWYQGSVFYDTDLYILPFYIFSMPSVAKACLNFRYLSLDNAREIARSLGFKGAKFAWQSGPFGEEVLGDWWRFTHTNIHINADVCYALMLYWRAAGDDDFMINKGVEILIECARFYADRGEWNMDDTQFGFADVAGPDEGHCESRDNFYTNYLAKRTFDWAADIVEWARSEYPDKYITIATKLKYNSSEASEWKRKAECMRFLFNPQTKVYEQYDGFYKLEPLPIGFFDNKADWWKTVAPYQAIHQPDVVMAQMMFRNEFDYDVLKANWDFYKHKSLNYSSMSYAVNAIAGAYFGEWNYAADQFLICAGEDLDETLTGRGDTQDGLHGTASGAAWLALIMGFAGLQITDKGLLMNPALPPQWKRIQFSLQLKGMLCRFNLTQKQVFVDIEPDKGKTMNAIIAGNAVELAPGKTIAVILD